MPTNFHMQAWRPAAQRVAIQAPQQQCFYRLMPVDVDGATGLPCVEPGESLFVLGVGSMEPSPAPVPAQWLPAVAFAQPTPRSAFGPVARPEATPQYARAVPWHAVDRHADAEPLRQLALVGGLGSCSPRVDFAADMLAQNAAPAGASGITASTCASCSRCMPGEYSAAVKPAHFMSMPRAAAGSAGRHEGFTR